MFNVNMYVVCVLVGTLQRNLMSIVAKKGVSRYE